jgi:hypothetical protein
MEIFSALVLMSLPAGYHLITDSCWQLTDLVKVKITLRPTASLVLVSSTFWGPRPHFLLLWDSYDFISVGRPLWRQDGSVVCRSHLRHYMSSVLTLVGILRSRESVLFHICEGHYSVFCWLGSIELCHLLRCRRHTFIEPLPSKWRLFWLHYSAF